MHDSSDFERRGIPSVFVASSAFEEAADVQGEAIGFHPRRVFVEHPIQDRTDDEIRLIATKATDQLIDRLTG